MYFKSILFLAIAFSGVCSSQIFSRFDLGLEPSNLNLQAFKPDSFCTGCKSMVSFMSRFNATDKRQEYKHLFKSFCELYYPPSTDFQHGPCPMAVLGVFAAIDKMDPINHCDSIGACRQSFSSDLDEDEIEGDEESRDESDLDVPDQVKDSVCSFCEDTIKQVQEQLTDPKFIDQLHKHMDAFCDYLKTCDMDKECKQMLSKYLDQAIDFIKHLDPMHYCKAVKLCSAKQVAEKMIESKLAISPLVPFTRVGTVMNVELTPIPTDSRLEVRPDCILCKIIVKEVDKLLNDSRTEAEIEDGLKKVCGLIFPRHGGKRKNCDEMVTAYSKELIKLIADESNPELVCMLIDQCKYEAPEKIKQEADYDNSSPIDFSEFITMLDSDVPLNSMKTCVECKLFIKYMQDSFKDKKTQQTLKNWLYENLCKSLPDDKDFRASCQNMVDRYSRDFFKAVSEELEPGIVCADLKACKKKKMWAIHLVDDESSVKKIGTSLMEQLFNNAQETQKDTPTICDRCVDVVTKLDEYLSSHSVDDDVNKLISQVCDKIDDDNTRSTCAYVVKALGGRIVEAIHTMDNPRQLCTKVYLC